MKKSLALILACLLITGCGPVTEQFNGLTGNSDTSYSSSSVVSQSGSGESSSDSASKNDAGSSGTSQEPPFSSLPDSTSTSSQSSSSSSTTTSPSKPQSSSSTSTTTSSSKPQSSSSTSTTTSSSKPQSSSSTSTTTSSSKPQSSSSSSTTTSSSKPQSSSSTSAPTSSSKPQSSSNDPTKTAPPNDVIGNYNQRSQAAWEIEYANEVFRLVNEERVKAGLPEFKKLESLTESATVRAWECVVSYGHGRPDGQDFSTALTEQGIKWRMCGENIAAGQRTPQLVVTAWMNSPGHRANILNENYTYLGVGFYYDYDSIGGSYRYYWAQNFCTLR